MHSHSIQMSTRSCESTAQPASVKPFQERELHDAAGKGEVPGFNSDSLACGPPATKVRNPYGNDDAADVKIFLMDPSFTSELEVGLLEQKDDTDAGLRHEIPIPYETNGECTFAYRRTLQTRIRDLKLRNHNEYDMSKYMPIFIHDLLMQPGSLANVVGDTSPEQLIHRMTPAILPGFHAYVHSDTNLPCILQSSNSKDYVQGMVLFGQGKKGRKKIHQHYRTKTRRVTLAVEIEVVVPISAHHRLCPEDRWDLQRRTIRAHVWIWADVGSRDVHSRTKFPRWTLEHYISGTFRADPVLDVRDASAWPDAEVMVLEDDEKDEKDEKRDPRRDFLQAGIGSLDYERCQKFTGW